MGNVLRQGNGLEKDISVFLGLSIVIFFFVASGFVTYSNIVVVKKSSGIVAHTYDVIVTLDNILSFLKDAETGQRGFVLTGKDEYLEPYEAAARLTGEEVNKFQRLTQDNPEQQERVSFIRELVRAKFDELAQTIDLRRKQGFEKALAVVDTNRGKKVMDDLRAALGTMRKTEIDLRASRLKEMESAYGVAITTGIISSAFGILLAMVIAGLLRRAAQQRSEEEWFKTGQAGLSMAMLGDLTVAQLGQNILKFLGEYFDAHAGAFFAKDDNCYLRMATYGLPAGGCVERFTDNDSLLGQAVKDTHPFIVRNVPDGYLKIGSGLGQSNPRHLIIAPGLADGRVNAVLELGFVHPLDERAIELLNRTSRSIGIAVQSAHYRDNLQRLLEETQSQSEELQAQAEELRVSNEELEEKTRTLQESQSLLEQQQEELEASNEEMEEKARELEEQNSRIREQSRDLAEHKRAIEDKARELELSGKYKSEFLANMSHELRTPLNSLLILARSLAANEDGNLTAEQVEEAGIIHNGGLELLSLINDILDLSKVEAGKLTLIAENVRLGDIAKRLERQFEPIVRETRLAFSVRLAPELPPAIHTDMQRVEQILKNLLSNACKFTEQGSVTLDIFRPDRAVVLQRTSLDPNHTVAFAVTDTGIGIAESKLNAIFEAFQQEDGSIDRHYGGTGLGLTIARKFAHMLGGEIHVVSEKGKGSTFTLMLPDNWAPAETIADKGPEPAPVKKHDALRAEIKAMPKAAIREFIADDRAAIHEKDKVLLIIEDDRAFAQTLVKTGRKRGYKCLAAGDGKTGILLAAEQPVSAIILDLRLPDIDGITVLDQLKHDLRTRHIPVHIITGRDEGDTVAPLRKGAIGYVTKPAQTEDLERVFAKIEAVLKSPIRKILVIEDDRKSQAAIQNLLRNKDAEIICAGKGSAALQLLADERFDCVILDLQLPDMSGFDLLEAAEAQANGHGTPPVIIYTARELTEDENRKLSRHTGSIVIKGVHSSERLLDEVTLFLHSVESALSKDQQAVIRMQHNPDKMLRDRTVLLVDDDMRNTFALSKLLKKNGMNVVIADNGEMAIEKLKQEKDIELVIMDIMMPVMDGYQAISAIRGNKAWHGLPVIALTARAMPEEQEKCLATGANDYMMKPVDIERLLTLMRVWLFRQDTLA